MKSDDFLDQEYENLNNAILRAIVASEDVQAILSWFKKQNYMDENAVLNLFLSIKELHQMTNDKPSEPVLYKMEPRSTEKSVRNEEIPYLGTETIIDGKMLTSNEVLFEKFYQESFNEFNWMKKARVRY